MPEKAQNPLTGLPAAITAYTIWGFLPLYLTLLNHVRPAEFVGWRVIWTLPFCLLVVLFRREWGALLSATKDRRAMVMLLASATLIGTNWLVYVYAVHEGQIYAASLGYYINPLINILLGTVVLKERLNRLQWAAVGLAVFGVSLLLGGALSTLWISLTLACSFSLYGFLRKQVNVNSLNGLTIETALLLLPASLLVFTYAGSAEGSAFFMDTKTSALLVLSGAVTACPLLLFAMAARQMSYSALGFTQFLAPTIVFILGLTVFDTPPKPVQLYCFIFIWAAVAIFAYDLVQKARKSA